MLPWIHKGLGKIYFGWWMVAIGSAVRIVGGGLHYYGSSIFFLPVSQELGLSRAATALVFSLARAQGAVEGPLAGYIIDRYQRSRVMASAMLASLIGIVVLIDALAEWHLWIYLVLFAAAEAVFPVTWTAIVDFFGRKNFAKIRGAMSFIYTWGGVLGPVAAGLIYDRTQDYGLMLWIIATVLVVAGASYAVLAKPPAAKAAVHE
jgi:MFS transporter, OFA family, oxalate/formate antiporter